MDATRTFYHPVYSGPPDFILTQKGGEKIMLKIQVSITGDKDKVKKFVGDCSHWMKKIGLGNDKVVPEPAATENENIFSAVLNF